MYEILISFLVLKTLQQLHLSFIFTMVVSLYLDPVFLVAFHSAVSEREYTLASSERIGTVTFLSGRFYQYGLRSGDFLSSVLLLV